MEKMIKCFITVIITACLYSCSKYSQPPGTASLIIVNAVAGDTAVALTLNNPDTVLFTSSLLLINNNGFQAFSSYYGPQLFHLHEFSLNTYTADYPALFNTELNLPIGSIHSLFLTGTVTNPDTLFIEDHPITFQTSDSSMGLRFVNLSPGSAPVSVNIQGAVNGNEVSHLPYKGITEFKKYPAKASVSSMTFEFRDAARGTLLSTYTIADINNPGTSTSNIWRSHNHTLVFDGLPGTDQSTPQTTFIVNNY